MKQTSRALLAAAISAICMGAMQTTAHAGSFNFEYESTVEEDFFFHPPGAPADGTPFSASLVITTAGDASSFEAITGVTGTIFGQTITGLHGGYIWSVNRFMANAPYLNDYGVVMIGPGSDKWFAEGTPSGEIRFRNETQGWSTRSSLLVNVAPVSAVPEPGTYAMLIAGLGVLGAVSRRQKKKSAPHVAALA